MQQWDALECYVKVPQIVGMLMCKIFIECLRNKLLFCYIIPNPKLNFGNFCIPLLSLLYEDVFVKLVMSHALYQGTTELHFLYVWRAKSCLDLLQSLKQFFINVSYHILVASLTLMALF